MEVCNAYAVLKAEIERFVRKAFEELSLRCEFEVEKSLPGYGDVTVNFYKALRDREKAETLAAEVASKLKGKIKYVGEVEAKGGFLNFKIDPNEYGLLVWKVVRRMGKRYGYNPHPNPRKIIIEHTSANPVHPLHVGHLRNTIIGDALARLLEMRGHRVETHFYIDDVGLQMAYAAYGYEKVKHIKRNIKPDHFVGLVYAITSAIVNIRELEKKRVSIDDPEERSRIDRELTDWLWVAKELMERDEELFTEISEATKAEDPLEKIYAINRGYEKGEKWAVSLVREVAETCIRGFKQTLDRLGVSFDSWDWESEVTVWNGLAEEVIRKLQSLGYVREKRGALVFEADRLAEDPELRAKLRVPKSFAVAPLTLVRSDGTTLYATRDIAYSIWKFSRGVDEVINVIAAQQSLEQIQVRLALYALGYRKEAENLIHFSYEMVNLPGVKMSGRRGRYVTADELIDEAVKRAGEEITKRGVEPELRRDIAEKVGIGAIKYAILSVSSSRPLLFSWDKVLDFERNSGPFVQYAYVRAKSVLRRSGSLQPEVVERAFGNEERRLIFLVSYLPEVVAKAADELRIELVAQYMNELALAFNKYYDEVPILKAEPVEKAKARLALVEMVAVALENGMRILGIEPPHRM